MAHVSLAPKRDFGARRIHHLRCHWIHGPAALHGKTPKLEGLGEYGASGWSLGIFVAHQEHDSRATEEQESRQNERQPISNILFCIDHADLANQGANVDHEIEVHVNTGDGHRWIDNGSLATLFDLDVLSRMFRLVLFGDERRDVWFEASHADTEDDQADGEGSDGAIRVGDDRGEGGDDENYVTDDSNEDRDMDGFVSPPVLVGHICTH